MSNQALSFIGRLDKREESIVMNQLQEKAFLERLMGNRGRKTLDKMFGIRQVRDVYCPPSRNLNGSAKVMSKN